MNYLLKHFFISLSLCYVVSNIHAQQIVHLDSKNGLINGTIHAIEKDSLGYIWIGSDQGINRYSGTEFKNYDLQKYNKNKGEGILEIIILEGDLYILSAGGSILKYYYELDRFEKVISIPNVKFLSLVALSKSHLLIGLDTGFIVYDIENNKHTSIPVSYTHLYCFQYHRQ